MLNKNYHLFKYDSHEARWLVCINLIPRFAQILFLAFMDPADGRCSETARAAR
ncbi:protein of unknown function (plasmid) [Cupriavidus taiwanensis]|nr:protein of unknown function [Cupriavidus taiwanensis]